MHVPVMLQEMLHAINPRPRGVYLDGTLGAGGYAEAILAASDPDSMLVGLDLDPHAIARCTLRLDQYGERFKPAHGGFHDAKEILATLGIEEIDGAVMDLGLSSDQLEDPSRGFAFKESGPLDMRFDTTSGETLEHLLGRISQQDLTRVLEIYGEETHAKRVARSILAARDKRELATTKDLVRAITGIRAGKRGKIHPATRSFQALRIAVNKETEHLSQALEQIPSLLRPGGRLCVVSYHSLEDRLVKVSFRERKADATHWVVLTPKPLRPTREEIAHNPRARSAHMRVLARAD
ncbi:MAG: 16S rRNA (cytosine(1402)-N(4))-methyltransferase RsmH [Thermodesulfobacteriota bacterium]